MSGKKYVLLVDHNAQFAKAFRDHFLQKNPQVELEIADNAREALKHLSLKPCDLLIADLRLPEIDGLQLILRVSQRYPQLTKLVMAAHTNPRDSQKAKDYGSVLHVEKPTTPAGYDSAVGQIAGILAKTPDIPRGELSELKLDEMLADGDEPPKECMLIVYAETGAGLLYLKGGRIIHAETPESRGSDALRDMLSWKGGRFEKRSFHEPKKRTLDIPWDEIFAVWMQEKSRIMTQPSPAVTHIPATPAAAPAMPAPPSSPQPASKAQVPAAAAKSAKPTEGWVRMPAPTTMGIKPAPLGAPEEEVPAPPKIPRKLGDSDQVIPPENEATARVKPAPAERAPSPNDVPLNEELITGSGILFALQIDSKGKVQQEIHCPDVKLYIGVATFTAAKARELAHLFQWEAPRSLHFIHSSIDLAIFPSPDKTILLGWASGQDSMPDTVSNVFGAGLLDPVSATKPRLPATIEAMKKIPGMHGYCIFNKDHQILVKKFSPQWSFELLQQTSRIAAQMCMVLQLQKLAVKLAQIKFDNGSIFAIPSGDMMLITICHHQAKVPLLKDCLSRITTNEINKAVL